MKFKKMGNFVKIRLDRFAFIETLNNLEQRSSTALVAFLYDRQIIDVTFLVHRCNLPLSTQSCVACLKYSPFVKYCKTRILIQYFKIIIEGAFIICFLFTWLIIPGLLVMVTDQNLFFKYSIVLISKDSKISQWHQQY